jgi:hypothetical protein
MWVKILKYLKLIYIWYKVQTTKARVRNNIQLSLVFQRMMKPIYISFGNPKLIGGVLQDMGGGGGGGLIFSRQHSSNSWKVIS